MALKDRYAGLLRGLPSRLARAEAKKSWVNRDLPNWRDQVGDLLKGKQIFVKDLREFNALYVAARRKGLQTRRFKLSNARFAVVAEGLYDRKIEFIAAGNVYYTRRKELTCLLKAAEKEGIRLDHSAIDKTNPQIVRVCSANKDSSIKQSACWLASNNTKEKCQ
jgi:hypothetical protein